MANVLQPVREVRFSPVAVHLSSDGTVERAAITEDAEPPEQQPGTCRDEARSEDLRKSADDAGSGGIYGLNEDELELWGLTDQSWTEKRESILGSGRGTPRDYQAPEYFRTDIIKGPGTGSVIVQPEPKLPPPVFPPSGSPFSRASPFGRSSSVASPGQGSVH